MSPRRLSLIVAFLFSVVFFACGGGELAPDGQAAESSLNQGQTATLNLRVNTVRAQAVPNIAILVVSIVDPQSFVDLAPPVTIPFLPGNRLLTFPNVPVGARILRIEGFTDPPSVDGVSGLPFANISRDFPFTVNAGIAVTANIEVSTAGITGTITDGTPTRVPQAGTVAQVGNQPGVDETQPEVDMFGLSGAITFRRSSGGMNGDVFADVFRVDSVNFTGPVQDIDGQATGLMVNAPGTANRQGPVVAIDQLSNFTVVWQDLTTADIHGRSYRADATPLAAEQTDLTESGFANIDPGRPLFHSTTNPSPPPNTGQGGEVRHMLYMGNQMGAPMLGYKTFAPDVPACSPTTFCPPMSNLVDCTCLFNDNLFMGVTPPTGFLAPTLTSKLALAVFSDGFSSLVAYETGMDVFVFTTRPWVGIGLNLPSWFKVSMNSAPTGEVDVATVGFRFAIGEDRYVVVYEQNQMIYARSYRFLNGDNLEVAGETLIGPGTQPRASSAETDNFYVTWISPTGEVMLDVLRHSDLSRVSTQPAHQVSNSLVTAGTSTSPRIGTSSFGTVVVWEAEDSTGNRGIFEKRFDVGFQP